MPDNTPIDINKKKFCIMPFMAVHINSRGLIGPCCHAQSVPVLPYGKDLNIKNHNVKDVFYGKKFNNIRETFLAGESPAVCNQICPLNSTATLRDGAKHPGWIAPLFDENDIRPKHWHVAFSNICNFKCRTCNPSASILVEKETLKHRDEYPILKEYKNCNESAFCDHLILDAIKENWENIESLNFYGGEPMITPQFWEILEFFVSKNKTDISLRWDTNGSFLKYKNYNIIQILKKFNKHKTFISFSIDEVGERAELLRKNTHWKDIKRNFLELKDADVGTCLLNATVSCMNVYRLPEILAYFREHKMLTKSDSTNFYWNFVQNPVWYNFSVFNNEAKGIIINKMKKYLDFYLERDETYFAEVIKNVIETLNNFNYKKQHFDSFLQATLAKDNIRKESLFDTFPELKKIFNLAN